MPTDYRTFIAREIGPLADGLVDCLEQTAPEVAVRINRRKLRAAGVPDDWLPEVCRAGEKVAWWPEGHLLPERPDFTHDPALHQGLYYVQDASSMITAHVVGALSARLGGAPLLMLDACAAPGGKSTAALDALPVGSMLVANEFDFRRASILAENIQKWGCPAVAVSRGDTARFRRLPELFDIVAADVPCSGEGMMRKDAQACAQWSERLVDECAARQWEIVENLWETLVPGGFFIYSTCTFNTRCRKIAESWSTIKAACASSPHACAAKGYSWPSSASQAGGPQPSSATPLPRPEGRRKRAGIVVLRPSFSPAAVRRPKPLI